MQMKKLALAASIAVAMSAPAFASDVEVYGSVGVNYDVTKMEGERAEDRINAVRGTEIGVRGGVAANQLFDVLYDLRLELEDRDEDNLGVAMAQANVTLASQYVDVTLGRADSAFDDATRSFDKFDGHFLPEYELFDSVAAGERAIVAVNPVSGLVIAADIGLPSGEANRVADEFAFTATYSVAGATFAAGYGQEEYKYFGDEGVEAEKISGYNFGAGYDFSAIGAKGLTAGFAFKSAEDKDYDYELTQWGLTAAYEVTADLTLIAGYGQTKHESGSWDLTEDLVRVAADYAITDNVVATTGFAHLSDDEKEFDNDEFMFTMGIKYNF